MHILRQCENASKLEIPSDNLFSLRRRNTSFNTFFQLNVSAGSEAMSCSSLAGAGGTHPEEPCVQGKQHGVQLVTRDAFGRGDQRWNVSTSTCMIRASTATFFSAVKAYNSIFNNVLNRTALRHIIDTHTSQLRCAAKCDSPMLDTNSTDWRSA